MNMIRLLTFLALFSAALNVAPESVYAGQSTATDNSRAELIVEPKAIRAGEPVWVGLALTMQPGWHHYWINPGDSGMAAMLDWSLPEGFEAGPIHWPTPERIEYADLYNYGYDGTEALLVPITPPKDLTHGDYRLTLTASWLVCKDICIPESTEFTFTLSTSTPYVNASTPSALEGFLAELPNIYEGEASYEASDKSVTLSLDAELLQLDNVLQVWWFPQDDGIITNSSNQQFDVIDGRLLVRADRGAMDLVDPYRGIVRIDDNAGTRELHVSATLAQPTTAAVIAQDSTPSATLSMTLISAVLFAFLGGIILNIMPCVLPILSLKALSIAKKSGHEAAKVRVQGMAYTAGILVSFAAIAGLLIVLQQAGHTIGWGFQLQSPAFVTVLAYILFVVGLNLSGVFELSFSFTGIGEGKTRGDSISASFFTGVLATLVATPCTAPFMATAIGFALSQPAIYALLIFLSLGLGLAFPLLLISFVPALYRILPKPGTWMVRFKQFLAFPIYASAAWMLWVLAQQSGPIGLAAALAGICLIAFAAWLLPLLHSAPARIIAWLALIALIICTLNQQTTTQNNMAATTAMSEPFSAQKLEAYRAQGVPVFVDATAAWCITCKVNEKIAINVPSVQKAFAEKGVKLMIADWTNRDAAITDYLASFGRNGVPIYVYYAPNQEPVVLPQLLTPAIVLDAIQ